MEEQDKLETLLMETKKQLENDLKLSKEISEMVDKLKADIEHMSNKENRKSNIEKSHPTDHNNQGNSVK